MQLYTNTCQLPSLHCLGGINEIHLMGFFSTWLKIHPHHFKSTLEKTYTLHFFHTQWSLKGKFSEISFSVLLQWLVHLYLSKYKARQGCDKFAQKTFLLNVRLLSQ